MRNGVGRGRGGGGEGVSRRVSCRFCGRELTVRNMTRQPPPVLQGVGSRGGGPDPASGEWPEKEVTGFIKWIKYGAKLE